jgi:hypothetical protein
MIRLLQIVMRPETASQCDCTRYWTQRRRTIKKKPEPTGLFFACGGAGDEERMSAASRNFFSRAKKLPSFRITELYQGMMERR